MSKQILYFYIKKATNYFFQGLFYTAPICITAYVLVKLFMFFNSLLVTKIPGLGIVIILFAITIIGWLSAKIIHKPILKYFEGIIEKTPLVKLIYTSVKDLVSAFVGQKKKFNQPVLVKMTETGLERVGFIMEEDLHVLGLNNEKVAVYFPMSVSIAGDLFIVPVTQITKLNASSTEVMKFIVSGGISS